MRTPFDAADDASESDDDLLYATRIAAHPSLDLEPAFLAAEVLARSRKWRSKAEFDAAVHRELPDLRTPTPTEPRAQARECLARGARALAEGHEAAAAAYLDEAFALDPRNPDVLRLRAERDVLPHEQLPLVEDAIAEALARVGGPATVAQHLGEAWTVPALRPYLRARGRKVELLLELGRTAQGAAEGETLLDLDPTDELTMRYRLVGAHLLLHDPTAYRRLRARFPDDPSACFLWGDVLAALLSGDEDAASLALGLALDDGSGIEGSLLAPWDEESDVPDRCVAGEESELPFVVDTLYPAWCAAPSALAWLLTGIRRKPGRSKEVRKVLASLRPARDDGPEPRWLEWALLGNRRAPQGLLAAIRADGERGIAWLCQLLRRDDLEGVKAPGAGFGPATAAVLLGELAAPSALPAQLEVLDGAGLESMVSVHVVQSFRRFGARALEPLLALLAEQPIAIDEGPTHRDAIVMALSSLRVPDARILREVEALFRRKADVGAACFVSLGMPEALPVLAAWLDAQCVGLVDDVPEYAELFDTVADAATALGGSLSASQAQKRMRLHAILEASFDDGDDLDDPDDDDDLWGEDPALAGDDLPDEAVFRAALDDMLRPAREKKPRGPGKAAPPPLRPVPGKPVGRNARCPCGSGKKYKACCWDTDLGS